MKGFLLKIINPIYRLLNSQSYKTFYRFVFARNFYVKLALFSQFLLLISLWIIWFLKIVPGAYPVNLPINYILETRPVWLLTLPSLISCCFIINLAAVFVIYQKQKFIAYLISGTTIFIIGLGLFIEIIYLYKF